MEKIEYFPGVFLAKRDQKRKKKKKGNEKLGRKLYRQDAFKWMMIFTRISQKTGLSLC